MKKTDKIHHELKQNVINDAKIFNLTTPGLSDIYNWFSDVLHYNQEKFNIECTGSGSGLMDDFKFIDFGFLIPKDMPLPEELLKLIYADIDIKFEIECKKSTYPNKPEYDYYKIMIKEHVSNIEDYLILEEP